MKQAIAIAALVALASSASAQHPVECTDCHDVAVTLSTHGGTQMIPAELGTHEARIRPQDGSVQFFWNLLPGELGARDGVNLGAPGIAWDFFCWTEAFEPDPVFDYLACGVRINGARFRYIPFAAAVDRTETPWRFQGFWVQAYDELTGDGFAFQFAPFTWDPATNEATR